MITYGLCSSLLRSGETYEAPYSAYKWGSLRVLRRFTTTRLRLAVPQFSSPTPASRTREPFDRPDVRWTAERTFLLPFPSTGFSRRVEASRLSPAHAVTSPLSASSPSLLLFPCPTAIYSPVRTDAYPFPAVPAPLAVLSQLHRCAYVSAPNPCTALALAK